MKENENSARKISDVLKDVTSGRKIQSKLDETKVKKAWKEIVGSHLIKYVDKAFYKNRILYVYITSAPMKQEFHLSQEKIKQRINKSCNEKLVDKIEIR